MNPRLVTWKVYRPRTGPATSPMKSAKLGQPRLPVALAQIWVSERTMLKIVQVLN